MCSVKRTVRSMYVYEMCCAKFQGRTRGAVVAVLSPHQYLHQLLWHPVALVVPVAVVPAGRSGLPVPVALLIDNAQL